jgi:uncharacterized protein YutE (UPF0331/DUF86 family)
MQPHLKKGIGRKAIRKSVRKFIRDFERKSGISVPELTKKFIFNVARREFSEVNVEEIPKFLSQKISELNQSMKNFEEMSKKVDEKYKLMVNKLAIDLYKNEKEPFLDFWQHMPVINYCNQVSEDLENMGKYGVKEETKVFILSSLYVAFYELAIELLFDIVLRIAKRSPDDEISVKLKKSHERKPYTRDALFEFLRKKGYLDKEEFLVQLSYFRDKIAHLLVYYDSERKKLFVGGKYVDPLTLREMYETLLGMFSYTIVAFYRESGLSNQMEDLQTRLDQKRALTTASRGISS